MVATLLVQNSLLRVLESDILSNCVSPYLPIRSQIVWWSTLYIHCQIVQEQELIPAAVDDTNIVEPSVQNGDAVSVLLPNLSILGVSESSHSSHIGTLPSTSCLDVTANPKASSCDSSSLSCSTAQGKSLIFDVRSVVSYSNWCNVYVAI